MQLGWITLSRTLMEHWIWTQERFSRGQAWVDLLLMVSYKTRRLLVDGQIVDVPRGSVVTSQSKLAIRWKWPRAKVRKFLDLLVSDQMITFYTTDRYTYITIVNYMTIQEGDSRKNTESDTGESPTGSSEIPFSVTGSVTGIDTGSVTGCITQKNKDNKYNKDNKENKENKALDAMLVMRLYSDLCPSLPVHPKMTEARCNAVQDALESYSMDELREAFRMAEASDFLRGINNSGWTADFDWLLKPANLAKVLSGKYKKTPIPAGASGELGEAEMEAIRRILKEDPIHE